ncbi:MAG: SIS domain-containing protein [Saprospiraceae bacterium]|nr:SIS domain-containing protein [Saprospiraceae bacterium]MBK7609270.1 SIS domain-containing protein [Saprospiraceae bacterium]MBK8777237.1 SIS domain-containing protein [Saprospiraceae bacterium]MBP7801726.1 SIS domain-containing protein [Saprospiraceae bacterium]MBP8094577.1 SIS domain-containing protein [Saprospiraceae bacterium]
MTLTEKYLDCCLHMIDTVKSQQDAIRQAAAWFAESILKGRVVHVFGSGHSRIMVEEMWPRYGSFAGFNPIVELSMTFHNLVTGANGQRQAMYIENMPGLAAQILRNFKLSPIDTALIISSSGTNIVPCELAELFQSQGIKVVAIVTREHLAASQSKRPDGKKLHEFADLVLDNGAIAGDAMIRIPGMDMPVSPGSTVGSVMLINTLKAELANILTLRGCPPKALVATCLVGKEKAEQVFNQAYDEHSTRMAALFDYKIPIQLP